MKQIPTLGSFIVVYPRVVLQAQKAVLFHEGRHVGEQTHPADSGVLKRVAWELLGAKVDGALCRAHLQRHVLLVHQGVGGDGCHDFAG